MTKVIGVRFRTAGKIYFFAPGEFDIKRGSHVIVETARGIEYGTVVGDIREIEDEEVIQPLKPVLRIATEKDDEQERANKEREKEAFQICLGKIREHGLDMKLIDAEYTFDNNKVLFYFTSAGRVDFRELVKDLASVFRTRIELRQIGVRDETKILGGIGICGRTLCCHSYLSEFVPTSIKMAKDQGLSLNPTKISGMCGKLMCCLKHEQETYEDLNCRLPNTGDFVTTPDGIRGEVHSVNVLRQKVKVLIEKGGEKEIQEFPVEQLQFKKRARKEKLDVSEEELKVLKEMEAQDEESLESDENTGRKKYDKKQSGDGHRDYINKDFANREPKNNKESEDQEEASARDIHEVLAEIKNTSQIDPEEQEELRPRNNHAKIIERGNRSGNRYERTERQEKNASRNDRNERKERGEYRGKGNNRPDNKNRQNFKGGKPRRGDRFDRKFEQGNIDSGSEEN